MRKLIISFVLAGFAITLSAQDLDKILKDHYKATAQDKISQITSATIKGKVVAMGMETGITMYQARPGKLRIEANIMGGKMIQTYNGTTGYIYAPTMGIMQPQEMSSEDLKNIVNQAEIDSPLWDYEAKGNKLEQAGMTDDGSAYMVKLTTSGGDEMTICLDKETFLISRILSTQVVNGMKNAIEIELKEYKNVQGIPTAHYMGTKMSGQLLSTINFESIEYNTDLDPSIFEKPSVE